MKGIAESEALIKRLREEVEQNLLAGPPGESGKTETKGAHFQGDVPPPRWAQELVALRQQVAQLRVEDRTKGVEPSKKRLREDYILMCMEDLVQWMADRQKDLQEAMPSGKPTMSQDRRWSEHGAMSAALERHGIDCESNRPGPPSDREGEVSSDDEPLLAVVSQPVQPVPDTLPTHRLLVDVPVRNVHPRLRSVSPTILDALEDELEASAMSTVLASSLAVRRLGRDRTQHNRRLVLTRGAVGEPGATVPASPQGLVAAGMAEPDNVQLHGCADRKDDDCSSAGSESCWGEREDIAEDDVVEWVHCLFPKNRASLQQVRRIGRRRNCHRWNTRVGGGWGPS